MTATPEVRRNASLLSTSGLAFVLLAGCASAPPPPTAGLQAAKQAIASAESAEANQYASGELAAARTKLASADAAVTSKNMVSAERLAEESRAEAELASAKTMSVKATAANNELRRSADVLTEEMRRTLGDRIGEQK